MSQKVLGEDGVTEIEVYTTEEVQAREAAARDGVKAEYEPKITDLTGKLTEAQQAAAARAGEFKHFRELNEKQVAELSEKDRIIYENQKALDAANKTNIEAAKTAHGNAVAAAIRARVGNDEALVGKVKGMYELVNLGDETPEAINTRVAAALGALGQTEPDLLAAAGLGMTGSFEPPRQKDKNEQSFADTEAGKAMAEDLGLIIEAPKK